eukprot:EG_transcript_17229
MQLPDIQSSSSTVHGDSPGNSEVSFGFGRLKRHSSTAFITSPANLLREANDVIGPTGVHRLRTAISATSPKRFLQVQVGGGEASTCESQCHSPLFPPTAPGTPAVLAHTFGPLSSPDRDYPAWLAAPEEEADFTTDDKEEEEEEWVVLDDVTPEYGPAKPLPGRCHACRLPVSAWSLFQEASHHCALCGGAFCSGCASFWTFLPHMGHFEKQRCCKECHARATGNRCPCPDFSCGPRTSLPLGGWLAKKTCAVLGGAC